MPFPMGWRVLALGLTCLAAGCTPSTSSKSVDASHAAGSAGPPWFADVTDESGLDFTHDPGPIDGTFFMPQSMGSGAAIFDFNNDGKLGIYLLQNGGPGSASKNRLFAQQHDGRFKD